MAQRKIEPLRLGLRRCSYYFDSAMSRWRIVLERWRAQPRLTRWIGAGALSVGLALFAGALLVPSLARDAVEKRAAERGLVVTVGSVRVGLASIWLRDVVIADPRLPGTAARLGAAEVSFSLGGVHAIRIHGGSVRLVGSEEQVRERIESLRAARASTAVADAPARKRVFELQGMDGVWSHGPRSVVVWGVRAQSTPGEAQRASADRVHVTSSRVRAEIVALEAQVALGPARLARLEAARVNARVELGAADEAPGRAGRPPVGGAPAPALWTRLRRELHGVTAPAFAGRIVALSVEGVRGRDALRIGPSRLTLLRDGDTARLEVAAHAVRDGGTPLGLRARIPLTSEGGELDVSGGPVSLAALGVRDGDFGLVGVRDTQLAAEARVEFAPANNEISVTSRGRLENARLYRPALAPEELRGIAVGWGVSAKARTDGTAFAFDKAELFVGQVRAELAGDIERTAERTRIDLRVAVPLSPCSALLEAVPVGAAPLLSGTKLGGTFALTGSLEFDSRELSATRAELDVANECRVTEVPPQLAPRRFRGPWSREVEGADGLPMRIDSGPGTGDWTPYEAISPHMETAVLVCEDEAFFRHRGFAYSAIENSIRDNLQARRFLRGASTVSMQLAKNLYLGKEKTLSRKLQEAVLTMLLEQELSKHEIMELYLNVIEFGPGIYGIGPAAHYYFNEEPGNLSLGQALYLGSILPNPDVQHFRADGQVTEKWSAYLRKLMQIAHKIRRISDEELAEGLAEQVAFRQPNLLGAVRAVDEAQEETPLVPELN